MNKRVLFILTSNDCAGEGGRETGFHLSEASHPARVLDGAGVEIAFASPAGGAAPVDPGSRNMEDGDNRWLLEDSPYRESLRNTRPVADLDPDGWAAVYFPGGHGTMWDLADNEELARFTAAVWERGGVVAAVCHGPAGLVNVKLSDDNWLVRDRELTSFTNEEEKAVKMDGVVPFLLESRLREHGARFTKAANFESHVVVDGRLVTGQNPASARGVGEAMVELLKT